jgi:crotonobetainyl-CoA:carnitine CoA-transferase CaiB-like acyl-CoA transferase
MTKPAADQQSNGPLDGIRILDLTWMMAGPYGTMLLADLGADVIKIESPAGDPVRAIPPHFPDDKERHFGGYFQSLNRNKRSVVLDLKSEEGRSAFFELIKKSDAVVENFRAGVMEKLGLNYEVLHEINPILVYASVRGFGDPRSGESKLNQRPAMDYIVQAMGGLMSVTGPANGEPVKVGPGVGDIFPGALSALGIVSAVLHAKATGKGQYVDVAMYDGIISLCERIIYQYGYTGETPMSTGNGHPLWSVYNTFRARDGYVCISATFDHEWAKLAKAMGKPELATDERFSTADARLKHDHLAIDIVTSWTKEKSRAEIIDEIAELIPAGAIQTAKDLFEDPHVKMREMVVELEHPGSLHRGRVAGVPIKFLSTPARIRRRAPKLGEHTAEVLEELTSTRLRSRRQE